MKIYLDIDGVLANFDKRYEELFGVAPTEPSKKEAHFHENWEAFVTGRNFTTLEELPDARQLLDYVFSLGVPVEILGSSGGKKFHDIVRAQKLEWLSAHGITCPVHIVPGGHLKARYAYGPWYILVDDTPRVIEGFRKAGGTGILHTSAAESIGQLKKLYSEWKYPVDKII